MKYTLLIIALFIYSCTPDKSYICVCVDGNGKEMGRYHITAKDHAKASFECGSRETQYNKSGGSLADVRCGVN